MTTGVYLAAPRYVLGEIDADHATLANLEDRAREFQMALDPKTWGWGRFRRARRGLDSMAVEVGSATLRGASVDPSSVDMLVVCSTRFPAGADNQGAFMQHLMTGLGLGNASFVGVTMNRCANLLAALQFAESLVTGGRHRRVLVITTDRVEDEAVRLESFALFSDGAAGCLVLGGGGGAAEYELVASAAAHDAEALGRSNEISADLSRRVNDRLLKPLGMTPAQVAGLMHANVYKPIVMMKEMQAGFTPAQLYAGNITRVGHCFAADPLINLVDRTGTGELPADGYFLLASSVPGSRFGVLLKGLVNS